MLRLIYIAMLVLLMLTVSITAKSKCSAVKSELPIFNLKNVPVMNGLKCNTPKRFNTNQGTVKFTLKPLPNFNHVKEGQTVFDMVGQPEWWMRYNVSVKNKKLSFNIITAAKEGMEPFSGSQLDNSIRTDISDWHIGRLHKIAVVWRGVNSRKPNAITRIYIDGAQVCKIEHPAVIDCPKTAESFTLGKAVYKKATQRPLVSISDVKIYDRALNAEELMKSAKKR